MAEAYSSNHSESLHDEVDSTFERANSAHNLMCSNVSNHDSKPLELNVLDPQFVQMLLDGDLDQLSLLCASQVEYNKDSFKNMPEELKKEEKMNVSRDEKNFNDKPKNTTIYSIDWKTNEEEDYENMETEWENVRKSQREMTLTNSRKDETNTTPTAVIMKTNKEETGGKTKRSLHLLDEGIPPRIPPRRHRSSSGKRGESVSGRITNEESNHEPTPPKRIIRKKITHLSFKHELAIFVKSFLVSFLSALYFLIWTGLCNFYPDLGFLTPNNHPDEEMRIFLLNFMNIIQFCIWGILVYTGYTRKGKQAPSFGFRKLLILPLLVEMVLLFAFLLAFCYEMTIDDRSPWDPVSKFVVPILANTILFSTHIYYYMNRPEKIVYEMYIRGYRQNTLI